MAKNKYTKYERVFIDEARKLKLRLTKDQEKHPVLVPTGKKRKKTYYIMPWSSKECAVVISCESSAKKKNFLKKIKGLNGRIHCDGDTESIVLFPSADLERAAKALRCAKGAPRRPRPGSLTGLTGDDILNGPKT